MPKDKAVWFQPITVEALNALNPDTLMAALGIEYTEIGADYLVARMAVDERTRQPMGLLHGGASLALAESVCSAAANCCIDSDRYLCVGMEINANHVRSVTTGLVTCTARPAYLGNTTQVWQFDVHNEDGSLICTGRQTAAVRPRRD